MISTLYDLTCEDNKGNTQYFSELRGRTVLVVNTASKCGLTPQFEGLQALHDRYKDKGLVVLGFPCDQFAHQEPGSAEEIESFCKVNYGVTFKIMKKIDVNGPFASPVFTWLRKKSRGLINILTGDNIKWNFTKFLISPDGTKVKRFSPTTKPEDIAPFIEGVLRERRE